MQAISGNIWYAVTWFFDAIPNFYPTFWGVLLLALALWKRNPLTSLLAGLALSWMLFGFLPGGRGEYIPEFIQSILLTFLVVDHLWNKKPSRGARYFVALIIILIAYGRFIDNDRFWPLLVCLGQAWLLAIACWCLRHLGYGVLSGMLLLALAGRYLQEIEPAMLVVAAGLMLFATGIAVTFNKERCIAAANRFKAVPVEAPVNTNNPQPPA